MINNLIKIIVFLIVWMPACTIADDFTIKLLSSPTPNEITIEIKFKFEQTSTLYHWGPAKSLYPILNYGLFIKCRNLDTNLDIPFFASGKVLPKFPHEQDVLEVNEYNEILNISPGVNYKIYPLKKGKYTLKLIYNPEELRKYPGGKKLTSLYIESNELLFEIN